MSAKDIKDHVYVNILCGGGGTRLWPSSRKKTPKQFIPLFGKETIFQKTVERALRLTSADKILVTTNADYVDEVIQQGKVILPRNIIAEPEKKNTALPMGIASVFAEKRDPEAVLINLASDHLITPVEKFVKNMAVATKAAFAGDYLVTVGIKPTLPHTGYGYIETEKKSGQIGGGSVFKVLKFTEKPDLVTAKKFIGKGNYYWNANLYTWRVDSAIRAFRTHAPKTAGLLEEIGEGLGTEKEAAVLRSAFARAEGISIDYAISEKAKNMLLVPSSFSWSDIGDWKVVYDLSEKDKDENAVSPESREVFLIGAKNCLVKSSQKMMGLIGVENLVVVNTPDALLICDKSKAQEVKKLVTLLKEKGKKEYL